MPKGEITRKWESLYTGYVILKVPYSDPRFYPFCDYLHPKDRQGYPTCREATERAGRDGRAENGRRLVLKKTMRLVPRHEEQRYRDDPNCVITRIEEDEASPRIRIKNKRSDISQTSGVFYIRLPKGFISVPYENASTRRDIMNGLHENDALELAKSVARFLRDGY